MYHIREKMDIQNIKTEHATSLNIHISKKMDIGKVKVGQLTLLTCLPNTLSLVSNLEVKAPKICAELFGNVYFIKLIPN